ncbi:hypothetical protein [Pseudomonas frederiksbergensis]|uniref:hypothetical protein n=1 Tax=Pseudomonas frederiksbergensis TaxID=104087 RepID=UPI000F475921|nr:hypothetical protein [Pseudomonas frederiksbergensis]RON44062.1 hypothetical protein BK667_27955 [Pseudomonas frederiksbergensis]
MDSTSIPSLPTDAVGFPALGPAFISADDAAYWAHRQIAQTRDRACGAVIVQSGDGQYRATFPVPGKHKLFFDFDDLLTKAPASRHFVVPEGYVGVAYFVSHAADHAETRRVHPDWTEEQITLYLGFFFFGHLLSFAQDPGPYGERHYLSGPDGSLIKYESTAPGRERQLFTPGVTRPGPFSDIERLIQQLARIGTLRVLIANTVWGARAGTVPDTWTLGKPVRFISIKDETTFFAPVANHTSGAIIAAGSAQRLEPNERYLGFVLRAAGSRERIATYPIASTRPTIDMMRVLHFDDINHLKLAAPPGYELDGVYFISRADTASSLQEPWLYEQFFAPDELADGLRFAHENSHRRQYGDELRVYTWTPDGAVLQYEPALTVAEQPLRDSTSFNRQLSSGALKPSDYVRQVASHGELSVILGSPLWDVGGRVGAEWQPYAGAQRLSPVFVTADDAARFAHQTIGSLRDQAYVGLILQSADKGFVATLPVPAYGPRFALDRLCPRDNTGAPLVLAAGYALHGLYASRWQGDVRPGSAHESTQMFTPDDIRLLLDSRNAVSVAYLSGAADSLLAYREDERALTARARLSERLAMDSLPVSDLMTELAASGELQVIVGSDLWGERGRVLGGGAQKQTLAPRLGARFATAELAVLDARQRARGDYRAASGGLGFILKHKTRQEYVATETVAAKDLNRLSQSSDFGAPVLIDEFRTHCVYYAASWLPRGLSTADGWFARHFMALTDLFAALYDDKGTQRLTHHQDLSLYIATLDGALLRYRYSSTSTLFDLAQGGTGVGDLLALMGRDTAPYLSVMRRIAASGELQVRVTSECWDEPGAVSAQWKPFALIQRRQLSPVFLWQDDAVRYAMTRIGQDRERVYAGLVLRRRDGRFVVTLPVAVDVEDFAPHWIRLDELADQGLFLAGSTVVARYHSRRRVEPIFALSSQQRALYLNLFSTDFLAAIVSTPISGTRLSPGDEYLIGLDGSLIRYCHGDGPAAQQLAQALAMPSVLQQRQTPLELQMRNGTLNPSDLVDRLAKAGQLQVVEGSAVWGSPRRVMQWSVPDLGVSALQRFAVAEPALSPLFSQLDDAARHVHRLAQNGQRLMFGYLLKSLTEACYVATLPVVASDGALMVERVFPQGLLPLGFAVQGLYLLAPTPSATDPSDLHRSFVSVRELTRALDALRVSSAQGDTYHGLYLSCADGALLHYSANRLAAEWASFPATHAYDIQLQSGAEPLIEYVRKLIKHGGLRVLARSRYWSPLRVDAKGVKSGIGLVRWPRDKRLALGPLFAHADDAARDAGNRLGPFADKQYLGGVLVQPNVDVCVAIEPLEDGPESGAAARLFYSGPGGPIAPVSGPGAVPLPIPEFPNGFRLGAVHQFYKITRVLNQTTEAERQLLNNLALADLRFSVDVLKKNALPGACCYLSSRGGALLKFTPNYTAQETTLLDEDPGAGVSRFFKLLTNISRLQVLDIDAYWQRPGRISPAQVPYPVVPQEPKHDEL